MGRHRPPVHHQRLINVLTAAGYHVMRQGSYGRLLERARMAERLRDYEVENAEHARAWARDQLTEQRRLADRLTDVAAAAAAQGVTIEAINAALHPGEPS